MRMGPGPLPGGGGGGAGYEGASAAPHAEVDVSLAGALRTPFGQGRGGFRGSRPTTAHSTRRTPLLSPPKHNRWPSVCDVRAPCDGFWAPFCVSTLLPAKPKLPTLLSLICNVSGQSMYSSTYRSLVPAVCAGRASVARAPALRVRPPRCAGTRTRLSTTTALRRKETPSSARSSRDVRNTRGTASPQRQSMRRHQGCIGRDGGTPLPSGAPSQCPVTVSLTASARSTAFVTDSNRPQPLWQHPPTARLTASGAASEVCSLLMHPWRAPHRTNVVAMDQGRTPTNASNTTAPGNKKESQDQEGAPLGPTAANARLRNPKIAKLPFEIAKPDRHAPRLDGAVAGDPSGACVGILCAHRAASPTPPNTHTQNTIGFVPQGPARLTLGECLPGAHPAHARRATFVWSILSLAPSLSPPSEVPQVDCTRPQTFPARHLA